MSCTTGSILNQHVICPALEAIDYTVIIQAIAIITSGFVLLAVVIFSAQLLLEILTNAGSWLGSLYESYSQERFIRKQAREIAITRLSQDISDGVLDEIDYDDPFWSDAGIKIFAPSSSGSEPRLSSQPSGFISHDVDDYSDSFWRSKGIPDGSSLESESSSISFWSPDDIDSSDLESAIFDGWRG